MVYGILMHFVHMSLHFCYFLVATILRLSYCPRNLKKLPLNNLNYSSATLAAWWYRENERKRNSSATANVTLQGKIFRSTSTL